ncbi:hypothetical protein [Glycomyces arizonensis]|uniref:hypothetical protein n=1 Tax=Glycomyces arizonensis TaxID=256035 RepID=UPI00042A62BE|nr:hypothetical protein [Glycomyces arizonensis]
MSSQLLLVTQLPVQPDAVDQTAKAWEQVNAEHGGDALLYRSLERPVLLEVRAANGLAELDGLRPLWAAQWQALAPRLAGDFRRQVHEFVEAPRPTDAPFPDSPYLQLRRVEVRPPVFEDYRAWRERTIFEIVRASDASEVFLAYHSLLGADPGVLFVAGFSCEPEVHNAVYRTPAYEAILVQARENFIVTDIGGDAGLFLETYARIGS